MTRLFISFYGGVLIVLFLAWYIHGSVLKHRADTEWERVVEAAHGGGARLVASELNSVPPLERDQVLQIIARRFDYPVTVVALPDLPSSLQQRITSGDDVASFRPGGIVVAALDGGTEVVRLGPFPNYDLKTIEESLGGWMRLVAEKLDAATLEERESILENLQREFAITIEIASRETLPDGPNKRIVQGDGIVFYSQDTQTPDRFFAVTPLSNGRETVRFGPFPSFQQIEQNAATTTLAFVLFPAALAIALLLRPIARQLGLVERTARAIAGGDFSARVDERKVKSAQTLAQAFNSMATRTETMLRTQRELLQAVSHELRTPLARIHFAIDLIRDAANEEQRETRLNSLDTAAQDLDELVGELLRYVRLETGEPQLELADLALRPLIEDLIEKQSPLFPTVTFEMDPSLLQGETNLRADHTNLARVFGNLLGNAGRFARSRVVIRTSEASDGIVIDVDDDGPGIPAEKREQVFDPFVRFDESNRGAGLGLALVRRIVSLHGGRVDALESPLGGCRIRTTWPLPKVR